MKIILASQSPPRKDLLSKMGLKFEVIPSQFEEILDSTRSTETVAVELALGKAQAVARLHPEAIVIGSDTIVTIDGQQLGKVNDKQRALEMLQLLSGRMHEVTTSIVVIKMDETVQLAGIDTSKVFFKPYDADKVATYLATGDYNDKAGAYGIQSGAANLIDHIEGEYDTIVGLPTKLLTSLLAMIDVEAEAVELLSPVDQSLG